MSYAVIYLEETPRYKGAVAVPTTGPYRVSTIPFYLPIQSAAASEGLKLMDRSDEQRGIYADPPQLVDDFVPTSDIQCRAYPNELVVMLTLSGFVPTFTAGAGVNKVITLASTGTVTGGTFTLTFTPPGGTAVTTAPIIWSASAAQVQAALEAVGGGTNFIVKANELLCAGTALPAGSITVTHQGQYTSQATSTITATSTGLTGTIPVITTTVSTAGSVGAVLDPDGNGIPTGAYKVTFAKRHTNTAKSATMHLAYTEDGFYQVAQGMGLSALSISSDGAVKGTGMPLYVDGEANPALTPAYEALAIKPFRRGDLVVTWLGGGANIQDFTIQFANPLEFGTHLGIQMYDPALLEHSKGQVGASGTIVKRNVSPTDYAAMRAATTFAAMARWRSPSMVGSSGAYYGMWFSMPATQLVSGSNDPLTNSRRFGANYNWLAGYDEASTSDVIPTIVCALANTAALETYV